MQQVTIQDYRDAFINENLPLSTIRIHRSVLQSFAKQGQEFNFNLTTFLVFHYLMFNANADARSVTFGEVSDVVNAEIGQYLGKKERTIDNEILKLCRAGILERHATKRRVFIIPSMKKARDEIAEQATMKKAMKVTETAEARIAELEKDGMIITEDIRRNVYASVQLHSNRENGNSNGQGKLPFE